MVWPSNGSRRLVFYTKRGGFGIEVIATIGNTVAIIVQSPQALYVGHQVPVSEDSSIGGSTTKKQASCQAQKNTQAGVRK